MSGRRATNRESSPGTPQPAYSSARRDPRRLKDKLLPPSVSPPGASATNCVHVRIERRGHHSFAAATPVARPSTVSQFAAVLGRESHVDEKGATMHPSRPHVTFLPKTAANWLTVDGRATGVAAANRVMTASFNPDGTQFVADAPGGARLGGNNLSSTRGHRRVGRVRWLWGTGELSRLVADGQTICRDPYVREQRTIVQFQEGASP